MRYVSLFLCFLRGISSVKGNIEAATVAVLKKYYLPACHPDPVASISLVSGAKQASAFKVFVFSQIFY